MAEYEQKLSKLSSKEGELKELKENLSKMQDKAYQVKLIELVLTVRYTEALKQHPIDRDQEAEIEKVIEAKHAALKDTLLTQRTRTGQVDKALKEQLRKIPRSWSKEGQKAEKAAYKSHDVCCREINKDCVDALKRLFGELEIDIKRFYKKGISKEYLLKLVKVMESICDEGNRKGTIPVSYHQKIYKWKQLADELPDDQEKRLLESEAAAEKKERDKLEKANQAVKDTRKAISAFSKSVSLEEQKLIELQESLADAKITYPAKKQSITDRHEKAKNLINQTLERIRATKKSLSTQKEINCAKIAQLQRERSNLESELIQAFSCAINEKREMLANKIAQYQDKKQRLETELDQVFILSFAKKQELRKKISAIDLSIAELQGEGQLLLAQSEKLSKKQLEDIGRDVAGSADLKEKIAIANASIAQMEDENQHLLAEMESLSEDASLVELEKVDREAQTELAVLDKEEKKLNAEISKLEQKIHKTKAQIEKLQSDLETNTKKISTLQKTLKDFHSYYLIKTYGKEVTVREKVKDTKEKIARLTSEIKQLNQEIAAAKKEEDCRAEALRQKQVKEAREAQRLKQEQQERQERIQRELLAREEEQAVIDAKAVSLDHIRMFLQKVESSSNLMTLQAENCPLEDDGKRVVTNSIVRKQYVQKRETPKCSKYLLLFVDQNGNAISEQRLIPQKSIGATTDTFFELKASKGFDQENYYLLILNFDTGDILSAEKYQINISFANDFDF